MTSTTLGIKVDSALRQRIKDAAKTLDRTPHWLIKQAIFTYLDQLQHGHIPPVLNSEGVFVSDADNQVQQQNAQPLQQIPQPFLEFAQNIAPQTPLRAAITNYWRMPETDCVPPLLAQATIHNNEQRQAIADMAIDLVDVLRQKRQSRSTGGVEDLIQEFSLSSQEGVALMCLAEALLRIPDTATRDALIRDKISHGDWRAHMGGEKPIFVNAATWGLMITGKLTSTNSMNSLSAALTKLIATGGEPLIRKGVDMSMRLMGEQFVTGQTIGKALANSQQYEAKGFSYSYDMLGEAAITMQDADSYLAAYEQAIHAIGKASNGRGIYAGPGISIKLSALHPRYSRAQQARVVSELLPRLQHLAILARQYDIGLNIDAEESNRLELSLDLLEALCFTPELNGWNGIGFVVQAYQKRCPRVLDWLIDLARRSQHRLMIRLVKGAYWDSEIKQAQIDGMEDYPVYTRKAHTDIAYIACAKKLLQVPDAIYPQFATHNAQTAATIYHIAGNNYYQGQYEFQCLHGMGEPLYEEITAGKYQRPCRIYAPVGTHETLLAYLVRRLLENGANSSFVNRIGDKAIPAQELAQDPVALVNNIHPLGAPHPHINLPRQLFGKTRLSAQGLDLDNEQRLASLSNAVLQSTQNTWQAAPTLDHTDHSTWEKQRWQVVRNPADTRDIVGNMVRAQATEMEQALALAAGAENLWQSTNSSERAQCLRQAADAMEARMPQLIGLIVREAGKSLPNAVGEVREAVDFLRYYAAQIADFNANTHRPLGTVLCISPWNFPLAIFTGQVAAALAAGNTVIAKPADSTALVAAQAVEIFYAAGIPQAALQLLPASGREIGDIVVTDARIKGVLFTGSTEVAQTINQTLAKRLNPDGQPIVLIAETGGQNAMMVDSSALAEQVVADVLASAFDSAGQRCSALRILCVQDDVADHTIDMLQAAMQELYIGSPDQLQTDVGPVIDAAAKKTIEAHIERMRNLGCNITQVPLPDSAAHGYFVAPTLIEITSIDQLQREVFGPVLHVLRYQREASAQTVAAINATGYGLTFGIHSRIDETIASLSENIEAGNVYVNRNVIGAVVGVQPFGGEGLSGTGPKAGGPLYLSRLLAQSPKQTNWLQGLPNTTPINHDHATQAHAAWSAWLEWLQQHGDNDTRAYAQWLDATPMRYAHVALPGPTGENNTYQLLPRGTIWCQASTPAGARAQLMAALATGNQILWHFSDTQTMQAIHNDLDSLPEPVQARLTWQENIDTQQADGLQQYSQALAAVLFEGDTDILQTVAQQAAARNGALLPVYGLTPRQIADGHYYEPMRLVQEKTISVNTAAAGGNASLMTLEEIER